MQDTGRGTEGDPRQATEERRAGHGLAVAAPLGLLAAPVVAAAAGSVELGPARAGWILRPSGSISSLGAGAVRTAVLAAVASVLLVERRAWAAGHVLASATLVHVANRVGKQVLSRLRPLDPQIGWALPRSVVISVLVVVLVGADRLVRSASPPNTEERAP